MADQKRCISVVLFDQFELLDVFGPVELYSLASDLVEIKFIAPKAGPVPSSQGVLVTAETDFQTAPVPDIVLIPGGMGTRRLAKDAPFLSWLGSWAGAASLITSVCTGSALLAAAGLLDGYRATSNKAAFAWVREQSDKVDWIPQARWVEDRNRWTSSGIAAGMDMTVALLANLFGQETAKAVAIRAELEVNEDSSRDPFAEIYGLVD